MSNIVFNFFLTVWGDHHTDLCIKLCLPSLMSSNNLQAISPQKQHTLWIYTTEKSVEKIIKASVYHSVSAIINIEFILISEADIGCPTIVINTCYRDLVNKVDTNSRIIWLAPDIVWADGTFSNLYRIAESGKKIVICPYFRAKEASFTNSLLDYTFTDTIKINPRNLVRLGLENIHPISQSLFWDSPNFNSWPCQIFWKVSPLGIIAKYFHAFPLMTTTDKNVLPEVSSFEAIDGGCYLGKLVTDQDDIYVAQDSDVMFCCEAVNESYVVHPYTEFEPQLIDIASWASKNGSDLQKYFFDHNIIIHSDEINKEYFDKIVYINVITNNILSYIEEIADLESGNFSKLSKYKSIVGSAASIITGSFDNHDLAKLSDSKSLFARFYLAVHFWIIGEDERSFALLSSVNCEYSQNLMRLIAKQQINILSQLDKGSWSDLFAAVSNDPKFAIYNIGFKEGDLPSRPDASIHNYYDPNSPPDFYITKMLEWHLIPPDIQELPCPIFCQTADYDIHIQIVFPWLNAFDELIIEHEWDDVTPLAQVPVITYPKVYPLLAAALHTPLVNGDRDIDIFISGTTFHPYHPDKALLLNRVLELENLNTIFIDGFLDESMYLPLLLRTKICITYIRRPGMPTRGIEALAMGCAVLVQENSSLLLYLKDGEGVFSYNEENLPQKINYILDNWDALKPGIDRAAAFVRSEFETSKVASQYFRFLTFLAAKPRQARKLVPRENLVHKRLILLKGWLLKPEIYRSLRQTAVERLERFQAMGASSADHFIDAAREMVLEYASSAHPDYADDFERMYGERSRPDQHLLEQALQCYKDGIRLFPRALVLRLNYIRTVLLFGSHEEIRKALAIGEETVHQPLSTWEVNPLHDVFPWDYFSQLFNYREYFDQIVACQRSESQDFSGLIRLAIASIHYHLSFFVDERHHAARAYDLDGTFPFYQLHYARLLSESRNADERRTAAELLYQLSCTSMLAREACGALQELAVADSYAESLSVSLQKKRIVLEKRIIKAEGGYQYGGFDYAGVPLKRLALSEPPACQTGSTAADSVHPVKHCNILFVCLEFSRWQQARSWSYQTGLGLEEGFGANGKSFVTIPVMQDLPPGDPGSWLNYIKEICRDKQFDQVWVEAVHNVLDEQILAFLEKVAPIRVALIAESLSYPEEVYNHAVHLQLRRDLVLQRLRYMTHALVGDEADVQWLNDAGVVKALWWVQGIPSWAIHTSLEPPIDGVACFNGAIYGERQRWLEHPQLRDVLRQERSPEYEYGLPSLFDRINHEVIERLQQMKQYSPELLDQHLDALRTLRKRSFELWLEGLARGAAVVNLPSFYQAYPGRIYEGMAAGRPVISWEIPGRPRTKALFEEDKEILLFPGDDPVKLAEQIRRVAHDPGFAKMIMDNASLKLFRYHTMETRVRQIFAWIESGVEPDYGEMDCSASSRRDVDSFYVDLWNDPSWSSPYPNTDEKVRWYKIALILEKYRQERTIAVGKVLDVGCGRGWLSRYLAPYGEYLGIEPVAGAVAIARKLFPEAEFQCNITGDMLPQYQNAFQLIVSTEVIEHIPYDRQATFIDDLNALLAPDGLLILTTPRKEIYEYILARGLCPQPIEDWLTEEQFEHLVTSHGFSVYEMERIYYDAATGGFYQNPNQQEIDSIGLIALYQVWGLVKESRISAHVLPSVEKTAAPMVSVIVPTYNRPDMLATTIQSILSQTFQDFEVVVVNDAGQDVQSVVRSFNSSKIVYLAHEINKGLAAARNTGINVARGKYIAYLDDDDTYYPQHLEMLVSFLENNDCKVAYTDAYRATQQFLDGRYQTVVRECLYSFDFDYDRILWQNFVPVLCFMHEKVCFEQAGMFDETLFRHEDWDLWIRMSRIYRFVHLPRVTCEYTHRLDGTGMVSGSAPSFLRSFDRISQKYSYLTAGRPEIRDAIANSRFMMLYGTFDFLGRKLATLQEQNLLAASPAELFDQLKSTGATVEELTSAVFQEAGRAAFPDYTVARELLSRSIEICPENVLARQKLAELFVNFGDEDAAIGHLEILFEINPIEPQLLCALARHYWAKDRKRALFFYERLLRVDPSHHEARARAAEGITQIGV